MVGSVNVENVIGDGLLVFAECDREGRDLVIVGCCNLGAVLDEGAHEGKVGLVDCVV